MKRSNMLGVGRGYTIVEALIFLAVSGALLISAMSLINGKQERTRFSQAVDEVGQNLQDIFNDVSTGFYPSANNLKCVANPLAPATPTTLSLTTDTTVSQGTNSGCVFSGKLIEFTPDSTDYAVYTMITASASTSFAGGLTYLAGGGGNVGIKDSKTNQDDLRLIKVVEKKSGAAVPSPATYKAIILVSDFGVSSGSALSGNAGKVKMYGYNGTVGSGKLDVTTPGLLVAIPSDSQVVLCLAQGGSNASRVASVYISPQLTIDRIIGSKDSVVC